jgi:hypothetical protein
MDEEPYDAADPVTSSESESEGPGPHRGKIFQIRKDPQTPKHHSQLQLQIPPQSNEKKGPIPTLAPGQVLSQKAMPRQKIANKAPRKAPVGGGKTARKTVLKPKRRTKPGSKLITIMITIDLPTNLLQLLHFVKLRDIKKRRSPSFPVRLSSAFSAK